MTDKAYKIVRFSAENIKKLTVVQITPDGNLVQITGKNGQGKSSVLDSIWWALAGTTGIQSRPIREGADEAYIKLDLGEIKVTRTFKRKADKDPPYTTILTVEAADGSRFNSPQTMLDKMIGALSFDPVAFTRKEPKQQIDMLRLFVPGFDFEAFDRQQKGDYEKRTDENRRARELRSQAAGIVAPEKRPEHVDESALVAKLEEAGEINKSIESRKLRREQARKDIEAKEKALDRHAQRIEALKREIAAAEQEIETTKAEAEDLRQKLANAPELPEPVDTADLTRRISEAIAAKDQAAAFGRKAELVAKADHHETAAKALTDAMEAREEHKRATIAAAKMPVPGLSMTDEAVLLNGKPFEQASQAEQLRTSIALAIAANPTIRVIRANGDSLDDDNIKLIAQMAEEADCQVWLERVASAGMGIVMVDGHVQNGEHIAADEKAVKVAGAEGNGHASPPAGAQKAKSKTTLTTGLASLRTGLGITLQEARAAKDESILSKWQTSVAVVMTTEALTPEDRKAWTDLLAAAWTNYDNPKWTPA